MKSVFDKTFLSFFTAALLLGSGCAPLTPADKVEMALDTGGELYLVMDSRTVMRNGAEFCNELERRIAESNSPRRDELQATLAGVKLAGKLIGLDRIEAVGASSVHLPDGRCINRCAAAGSDGNGIWQFAGTRAEHLHDLAELPDNAVAAASFSVDTGAISKVLFEGQDGKALNEKLNFLGTAASELLAAANGNWRFAVLPADENTALVGGDKYEFYLSLPDRDGVIFSRIKAFFAPGKDDRIIQLPGNGSPAPLISGGDGRIGYFSSPGCFDRMTGPHGLLGDKPELCEAAELLPSEVTGAFYFADARQNLCEVGIWDCDDKCIEVAAYSPRELADGLIGELLFSPLRMFVDGVLKLPPPKRQTSRFAALPRAVPGEELALRRKALADFGAGLAGKADKAGAVSPKFPDLVSFGRPEPGIPKFPVACEVPNPKRSRIGVLFADGTIEFFDFKAESLKHLCSFLHTRCRYEEKVFIRLIKRAVELDKQRKGSADERRTPAKSN